jgi:hypothetical protein
MMKFLSSVESCVGNGPIKIETFRARSTARGLIETVHDESCFGGSVDKSAVLNARDGFA